MPRALAALVAVFALLVGTTANAAPRWVSKDLPLSPSLTHRMAVVPLAPPSPEHPLGTVAIIGPDAAYAWDLEARKFLTGRSLGATNGQDTAVVAMRAGDEIFVLSGSYSHTFGSSEIVLMTLGLDLGVRSRDVVGRGIMPSLEVSDRWIVAGAFEKHASAPVAPGTENEIDPLALAFHAVVLDRKTRAIVAGRVFQGERLIFPGPQPRSALHAIAIHDERAFFSLPGVAEPRVVSTELPSLRTVKTPTAGSFGLVGRNLAVPTPQGCGQLLWAWDHPVALCGGDEGTGEPMRIRFRR